MWAKSKINLWQNTAIYFKCPNAMVFRYLSLIYIKINLQQKHNSKKHY